MSGALRRERPAPGVALLTLDRPAKRNALSASLMRELLDALAELATDGETRCTVITGAPPAFCAGGDLAELRGLDVDAYLAYCARYRELVARVRTLPFPLVAAVNGAVVAGGFELMCLCDIRVIADDARVVVGDADIGLPTTSGLAWILPRLVGVGRAHWLVHATPDVTGADAARFGLAEECVPATGVLPRALALARSIAEKPGIGVGLARRLIVDGLMQTHDEVVDAELAAQRLAFADPAARAAIDAFFTARRRPGAGPGAGAAAS